MVSFTLITSNKHKYAEFKRLVPSSLAFDYKGLDIPEIQSLDLEAIIKNKVLEAYKQIKHPVVVEDVSAGIDKLNGLPGPFVKFFEQALGRDALYQLAGEVTPATINCSIGYYDGKKLFTGSGVVKGKIVPASSDKGFGFDGVFMPNGYTQTFAEMGTELKDKVSHRSLAVAKLVQYLSYSL